MPSAASAQPLETCLAASNGTNTYRPNSRTSHHAKRRLRPITSDTTQLEQPRPRRGRTRRGLGNLAMPWCVEQCVETDLVADEAASFGRRTPMNAGPDASVDDLRADVEEVVERVDDARCVRAHQRERTWLEPEDAGEHNLGRAAERRVPSDVVR